MLRDKIVTMGACLGYYVMQWLAWLKSVTDWTNVIYNHCNVIYKMSYQRLNILNVLCFRVHVTSTQYIDVITMCLHKSYSTLCHMIDMISLGSVPVVSVVGATTLMLGL